MMPTQSGYIEYGGSTYSRESSSVRLLNGVPNSSFPHRAPFWFFDYTDIEEGTITKVELVFELASATTTGGTIGFGFHDQTLESSDADLFNAIRNINSGLATITVSNEDLGPHTLDLGESGITTVQEFIDAERDIALGSDLVSGASNWGCEFSSMQLMVTLQVGTQSPVAKSYYQKVLA